MTKDTKQAKSSLPAGFEVVRNVTLPILKIPAGGTVYVQITEPIRKKDKKDEDPHVAGVEPAEKGKRTISLLNVTNLETSEEQQIVVGGVLESTLNEEYPDDEYVGLYFAITKSSTKKGKVGAEYYTYSLQELDKKG